jgi:protease-4
MTLQVDSIAQGRVWAGSEALKLVLLTKNRSLDDAINEAAV